MQNSQRSSPHIPLVDLKAQYESIKFDIDNAIARVINESAFIRGPYVELFEEQFSHMIGIKNCISCANGTDSLFIALKSLGLQQLDEVIVPAHSWISTSETVTLAGGKVVFCDTDDQSFTIDTNQIESKITSRTVGIIPVHLYGQSCRMDKIMSIARKYKLWVIEDCAQAVMAKFKNQNVGTFGDAASFSFYPGKNLGAMGDAGALVTNDDQLATKMAMFARHGGLKKNQHNIEGMNSRLDGLQASILLAKLPYLQVWTTKRQALARRYNEKLSDLSFLETPKPAHWGEHVWHLYVIKTDRRDELISYMEVNDIQTAVNYPIALPFLPPYVQHGYCHQDFENAFQNQNRILSLPIYPEMTNEQQDWVVSTIKKFFHKIAMLLILSIAPPYLNI